MVSDLYKSKSWLLYQYRIKRRTLKEIAKECGVSEMQISRYVNKFELGKQ